MLRGEFAILLLYFEDKMLSKGTETAHTGAASEESP